MAAVRNGGAGARATVRKARQSGQSNTVIAPAIADLGAVRERDACERGAFAGVTEIVEDPPLLVDYS